jgi:hypothetical protein
MDDLVNIIDSKTKIGEIPERSNGVDCKSIGKAFGGSNPPLPTLNEVVVLKNNNLYSNHFLF